MGRCSRCGARKPESRVHKWCAKCLASYKQDRMTVSTTSTSSNDDLYAALKMLTYSPDKGEGDQPEESTGVEPVLKRCATCKSYKPLEEFSKDASRRDEKSISCKTCRNLAWQCRRKKRDEEGGDNAEEKDESAAPDEEEPPQKRSRGDDLYVFKNSRLPDYKIGRSSDIAARSQALQKSQNFHIQRVATFEGKGHLEDAVRKMLAYCLLPRKVAAGTEWHTCSLQTALAAIGQAIDEEAQQLHQP